MREVVFCGAEEMDRRPWRALVVAVLEANILSCISEFGFVRAISNGEEPKRELESMDKGSL